MTATLSEEFFQAYIETALWSSTNEDMEPLDGLYGPEDISDETLKAMREDCADFYAGSNGEFGESDSQAGHDFWLTRNGHGAGFWDRGLGERGDELTAMSKPYGEFYLYVGDDGLVHGS